MALLPGSGNGFPMPSVRSPQAVKAFINCKEVQFPEGTKFIEVVKLIREANKDEPMIRTIREKTGKDNILFVLNGRLVRTQEFDTLEVREGDDVRWVHPYFGG